MAYKSRKRKSDLDPTPPRKEQRLLIRSLECSNCYTDFQVEAITKNLTAECYVCSRKPNTDICGGYPFEIVDDEMQVSFPFQIHNFIVFLPGLRLVNFFCQLYVGTKSVLIFLNF